jgi:UDP-N-acetylglucosamine 2-epimerase (non-hydrolysing)
MIALTEKRLGFGGMSGRYGFDTARKNILVTLHRAENVDDPVRLRELVETVRSLSEHGHVVFPVHPRTAERLKAEGLAPELRRESITVSEPMGYLDFLSLERASDLIVTDSGGVQEEALVLGTPVMTLRYNTERPETVWNGSNHVVGTRPDHEMVEFLINKKKMKGLNIPNVLGDGKAGRRVAEITIAKIEEGLVPKSPDFRDSGSAVHRIIRVGRKVRLSQIEGIAAGVEVLAVYDSDGRPSMPFPDRELALGDLVAVLGGVLSVEKLVDMLNGNEILKVH